MTKTRERSRFLAFLKWTGISVAALAGLALVLNLTTGMHLQITGGLMPQLDFHHEDRHYRMIEAHREQRADVAPAASPAPARYRGRGDRRRSCSRSRTATDPRSRRGSRPRRRPARHGSSGPGGSRFRSGPRRHDAAVRFLALLPRSQHGRPLSRADRHGLAGRRPARTLARSGRRRLRVLRRRRRARLHDRAAPRARGRRRLRPADRGGTLERELGRPFRGEHGRRRSPRHAGPARRHAGRARRNGRVARPRRGNRRRNLAREHPRRRRFREPDLGHGCLAIHLRGRRPHRAGRPGRRGHRLRTRHRRRPLARARRRRRLHRARGLHAGRPAADRPDRSGPGRRPGHRRQQNLLEPPVGGR